MGALSGHNVIEYASGATSKQLTISANAMPVYFPNAQSVGISGAQITLSSVQVVDNTPASISKAVSTSSGTVKASAGTLFMILPTTAGDLDIKDGNTSIGRLAVTTSVINFGPWGIPFGTTISVSASAAVATFVYK